MNNQSIDGALLKKRANIKQNLCAWGLIAPYIIIFVVFTLVPVILGAVYSFMDYNPNKPDQATSVGLQNYIDLFNMENPFSKRFWNSFTPMLLFCLIAVPCMIVIPLGLAYLINMHPPGYKLFRAILYLPSVLSIAIAGIIFSCMFKGDDSGLINAWFNLDTQWMSGKPFENDVWRWVVMLLLSIWWQTGTNFVILSGALRDVPKSLYEACEMDGGNRWQLITRVTLPNIKPSINMCLFTTLIGYMNLYGQPYVINAADNKMDYFSPMQFIQYYLSTNAKLTGRVCAAAIVFGLCVMVVSIIQRSVTDSNRRSTKWGKKYTSYIEDKNYLQNVQNSTTEVQNG